MDRKGKFHPCESAAHLADAVSKDRNGDLDLAWSPRSGYLVVPEEIPEIADALISQRNRNIRIDFDVMRHRFLTVTGLLAAFALYLIVDDWSRLSSLEPWQGMVALFQAVTNSILLGIALLGWLIFAFIPFYQAWKRRRELACWNPASLTTWIPVYRFESWLAMQRAPVTCGFLATMGIVYVFQWLAPNDLLAAALIKEAYHIGETWRIFTAPFLHGMLPHLLMNGAAMWYLGRRIEILAKWPHLPLIFLVSAWLGAECSVRFIANPSVGASGGLMGWLGFLLVFETLHHRLVPKNARRRLLAGLILTMVIGLIGYRFIDNAAHLGGLIGGCLYAWIVFPKSASPHRPVTHFRDRIAGTLAIVILSASAGFAIWRLAIDWLGSR